LFRRGIALNNTLENRCSYRRHPVNRACCRRPDTKPGIGKGVRGGRQRDGRYKRQSRKGWGPKSVKKTPDRRGEGWVRTYKVHRQPIWRSEAGTVKSGLTRRHQQRENIGRRSRRFLNTRKKNLQVRAESKREGGFSG